jgi:hypothetical protein
MSELRLPVARPRRSRSTSAIRADLPGRNRWWLENEAPRPKLRSRQKRLEFQSGDPFDRFVVVRYLLVALSLIVPAVIITRAKLISDRQTSASEYSSALPSSYSASDLQRLTEFNKLRAQMGSEPDNVQVLRAFAQAAADFSPAEARRAYHRLNAMGQTTDTDSVGHAALLANLHDFTGAKAILSNIPKEAQELPLAQFAWLAIWREAGDFQAAASTLEKLTAQTPCDLEVVLDLVRKASLASAKPEILERLEGCLLQSLRHWMSTGRAQDVLALAGKIATSPISHTQHRTKVAQILRNLPGTPAEHRLAAVRFAYPAQLGTADQEQLRSDYQNEIAWSGGMGADDKRRVAAYLKSQGEHAVVTSLISEREALTEPPLFSCRFDSLLEQGLWREAGRMTASEQAPLLPHSRGLAQTLATLQNKTIRSFTVQILLAEALAASRMESRELDCYATGCAALDHSMPELAASAFATALDLSKNRSNTLQSILRSARQGKLPLATFMKALIGSPAMEDETVQDSLIYISLLAGEKVDAMLAIIRARRQSAPEQVYLRFLEALALHQQGQHQDAAALLIPLPRHRWHQGEAAVLASIISATGEIERSSPLIQQIDPSLLFVEERHLFDPWQSRLTLGTGLASRTGAE